MRRVNLQIHFNTLSAFTPSGAVDVEDFFCPDLTPSRSPRGRRASEGKEVPDER
jgi:hypothetical protein